MHVSPEMIKRQDNNMRHRVGALRSFLVKVDDLDISKSARETVNKALLAEIERYKKLISQ